MDNNGIGNEPKTFSSNFVVTSSEDVKPEEGVSTEEKAGVVNKRKRAQEETAKSKIGQKRTANIASLMTPAMKRKR